MAPGAHPSLRRTLLTILVALLVTAAVCLAEPRRHTGATALSSVQPLAMTPPPVARTPQATSSPSAAVTGHVGCGLALGASTATSPVGHCTVVEIGDSLGNDLGWGLAREVSPSSGLDLVQLDKSASGLAHPSFYDWPVQLDSALSRYHPQLVLICLGADDLQGMVVNGSAVQFGSAAWTKEYVARVHALALEATHAGAFVLWVGLPVMRPAGYDRGMQSLDTDIQTAIAPLPTATFLPTRRLFANAAGGFASDAVVNGSDAGLREADGIHLSLVGENVMATYVLQQLGSIYDVKVTPVAPAVVTG